MTDSTPPCDADPDSLSLDLARERLLSAIDPIARHEQVGLHDVDGRVLSTAIDAVRDVPPWPNSAMDGYACRRADIPSEGASLQLIGTSLAGHPYRSALAAGEAIRVTTGAPLPENADAVVMQEQASVDGDRLRFAASAAADTSFVRARGSDTPKGKRLFEAGTRLDPAQLAVLASQGLASVEVFAKPTVAVMSTGDELASVGETAGEQHIFDSNRPMLIALLKRLGAQVMDLGKVPDDPAAIEKSLRTASERADLIVSSGGVSVGVADHLRTVLESIGEIGFWKIAVKPGRPLTVGRIGGAHYIGLPGNPVSSLVTCRLLVEPALARLAGEAPLPQALRLRARAKTPLHKRPGRQEFQRAVLDREADGTHTVAALGAQESHLLLCASTANCLIDLPADSAGAAADDWVEVLPL